MQQARNKPQTTDGRGARGEKAVHLLPPHVYLQLLLGWGEHGLAGAVCATVALSHIAAAAAILGLAKFSLDSAVFFGVPGKKKLFTFTAIQNKASGL